MTFPIRRLTPLDAARYRALMLDAYARHPDAFTSSVTERAALPLSWWESRLAAEAMQAPERAAPGAPGELVVAVVVGNELAGVTGLSFESREKARHKATLFGMYVPPAWRGQGLGRRLVEAALAEARARPGTGLVQLTVTQGNAGAQALYAACGFVPFGVEPFAVAVGDRHVAKVHMWCNLRMPAPPGGAAE